MISLRNKFSLKAVFLMCILALSYSCSSTKAPERDPSSQSCWDKVRPEYQSYFDSVEKCIENKEQK
jgi:hypothetical protein